MSVKKVIVASLNPAKINAVKSAFLASFPTNRLNSLALACQAASLISR